MGVRGLIRLDQHICSAGIAALGMGASGADRQRPRTLEEQSLALVLPASPFAANQQGNAFRIPLLDESGRYRPVTRRIDRGVQMQKRGRFIKFGYYVRTVACL